MSEIMDTNGANKRQYKRIYFALDQEVDGIIDLSDSCNEDIRVKNLNLSKGGLFFTFIKDDIKKFRKGIPLF